MIDENNAPVAWEVIYYHDRNGTRVRASIVTYAPDKDDLEFQLGGKVTILATHALYYGKPNDT